MSHQQRLEASEIGRRYYELKGKRQNLIAEKMIEVDAEMEFARAEFAEYLQHVYERQNGSYKWTITGLAEAMGTPSGRQTVRSFLGEALERRRLSHIVDVRVEESGFSIVSTETWVGPFDSVYYKAIVETDVGEFEASVSGRKQRYTVIESGATRQYSRPLDNSAPAWLNWLDNNPKWLEFIEEG